METLIVGGGCFWCIQSAFALVEGVQQAEAGYAGGETLNPDYESVCKGHTGHAEVVKVTFDDSTVSCESLLSMFFALHDPTTLNRQGNDVGSQYRSVIFYQGEGQHEVVKKVLAELDATKVFDRPVVTEVKPLESYYEAEAYHQDYLNKNPANGYCQMVVAPKLMKFINQFKGELKPLSDQDRAD